MENKTKAAISAAIIGSLAIGAIGGALVADDSSQVQDLKLAVEVAEANALSANTALESYEPVIVTKIVNQTVEVEVPVLNPVNEQLLNQTIDFENTIDLLSEEIYDNNGKVQYLIDDLDDDEISLIADRIVVVNDFKALAVAELEKELFEELDNEEIVLADNSTYKFDEDELEKLRIDDDADEISIESIDFEDGDAKLKLTFTFEDEDNKEFKGEAIVEIRDFEVEDIDDIVVTEE